MPEPELLIKQACLLVYDSSVMMNSIKGDVNRAPAQNEPRRPIVVFIIGPTASGKTELAVRLAGRFAMEVISADSRQVYRRLDIATAKPDRRQQGFVKHWLIDIIEPSEDYNVALYQREANECIRTIQGAAKLPVVVGGSGMYLRALTEGYKFPAVPPQSSMRMELERRALAVGAPALHHELAEVDPDAAKSIHPHNLRRVIRALEVYRTTGRPFSELGRTTGPAFLPLIVGLHFERDALYRRIDLRVDRQVEAGLVEETRRLIQERIDLEKPAFSSLGYREIASYLRGDCSLEDAVQRIKFAVHRYARQQLTWFRRWPGDVTWLAGDDPELVSKATSLVERSVVRGT